MRFKIEHQIPGRIRVRFSGRLSAVNAIALETFLHTQPLVIGCVVYERTGSLAITYNFAADSANLNALDKDEFHNKSESKQIAADSTNLNALDYCDGTPSSEGESCAARTAILNMLLELSADDLAKYRPSEEMALALQSDKLFQKIVVTTAIHVVTHYFLPTPLSAAWSIFRAAGYILRGLRSLLHGRVDVPVLDGAAMASCLAKGDFGTAGSAMFMLTISELLEEQTRKRSEQSLISSLLEVSEKVWLVRRANESDGDTKLCEPSEPYEEEIFVEASTLKEGDLIVLRTGQSLPVDGVVASGEAWVNQSVLTGESACVLRTLGDDVFAGTAIDDGELQVRVTAAPEKTRLRSIVGLVEQAESLKSANQQRMEKLADRIVPFNLLYAGIVFAATRSLEKLSAALMVDYSCALRLTGSIAALAAMHEAATIGLRVKGSKAFESVAAADTIVFDKTGTLTQAIPAVADILPLGDWNQTEVIRLAACLEEHFPHPVARAVVAEAQARGIDHRERHAEVEYIVAHGIVSSLDGKRAIIGSGHFVFDDENIPRCAQCDSLLATASSDASPLYLAVDGKLVGVILISDPLKDGIADTIVSLRDIGFKRVIMLTGDNYNTAAFIANSAGITEFVADMLPEDKHQFIRKLKNDGFTVMMVGDGVNDSPALGEANVGVAMGRGAAIAREVADVTLASDDLNALLQLRLLSKRLMQRTNTAYTSSIIVNTALLLLGTAGVVTPSLSSLLHNTTTVALSLNGVRGYLGEAK
ncbi:MAG: heavy metal translocating P-type ATPase [Coriobacteriales bacterium]|jgi:heavy metal translocating P-type ATPase|nr:heavy metal translocating P-type ATPase [Coriobacteriales bacterium]